MLSVVVFDVGACVVGDCVVGACVVGTSDVDGCVVDGDDVVNGSGLSRFSEK